MDNVTGLKVWIHPKRAQNHQAVIQENKKQDYVEREEEYVEPLGIEFEWERGRDSEKRVMDMITGMFEGTSDEDVKAILEEVRRMSATREEVDGILEAVKMARK